MDPNEIKGVPTGDSKPCWHDRVTMQFQLYDEREPADNPYYKSARQEIELLEEVADTVDSLKKENELLLDANKLVNDKCERLIGENNQLNSDNAELLKVHKQMVERFDDSLKRGLMLVRSIENLSATVARLTADK